MIERKVQSPPRKQKLFKGREQLLNFFIPQSLKPPFAPRPGQSVPWARPSEKLVDAASALRGLWGGIQALQELGPMGCGEMAALAASLKICRLPPNFKLIKKRISYIFGDGGRRP